MAEKMEINRNSESVVYTEGPDDDGGVWLTQRSRKRNRRSTGGTYSETQVKETVCKISTDSFRKMSTDEKLVSLFEIITSFGSMNSRVSDLEDDVHALLSLNNASERRIKLLEYKSIDLEARNRRNNLIFRGHPEVMNADDCEAIILTFLSERLNINDVCIQRAHRLGSFRPAGRRPFMPRNPRPIIVCFRDYKDVVRILGNAYKLRDTNYGINRDYPPEIVNARSKLWADYKSEKAKPRRREGSVYIGFPAKLVVEGKVVRDEFPEWKDILRGSRVSSQKDPLVNASERGRPAQGNIVENPESLASPIHSQSILQKPVSTSGESDIETVMLSDKSDSESGNSRDVSPVGSTQTLSPVVGGKGTSTCKPTTDEYSRAMQRLKSTKGRATKADNPQTYTSSIIVKTPTKINSVDNGQCV